MVVKPEYRLGRIITTYQLLGRNKKRQEHPAVIISPDDEIIQPEYFDPRLGREELQDNLVVVLGISSQYQKFSDPYIQLPTGSQTQLIKDCAVILNWYGIVQLEDDVEYLLGDVPPNLMHQVNAAYRADLTKRLGGLLGN